MRKCKPQYVLVVWPNDRNTKKKDFYFKNGVVSVPTCIPGARNGQASYPRYCSRQMYCNEKFLTAISNHVARNMNLCFATFKINICNIKN
jgi:hypothetical protein